MPFRKRREPEILKYADIGIPFNLKTKLIDRFLRGNTSYLI